MIVFNHKIKLLFKTSCVLVLSLLVLNSNTYADVLVSSGSDGNAKSDTTKTDSTNTNSSNNNGNTNSNGGNNTNSNNNNGNNNTVGGTTVVTSDKTTNQQANGNLFTTEVQDGPTYLKNVLEATKAFNHNEILAAFASAALIPTKPEADFAAVCFQYTTKGLFRVHSQNPAALGLVTNKMDLDAFEALKKLNVGDTFDYNVAVTDNTTSSNTTTNITYKGQVFLKHGADTNNTTSGDAICFARYQ